MEVIHLILEIVILILLIVVLSKLSNCRSTGGAATRDEVPPPSQPTGG